MQWDSNIGDTVCRPLFHSISFSPTFSGIKMHEIIDIYIYKISTLSACNQRSTMCTVLKISFFFFIQMKMIEKCLVKPCWKN